MNPSSNKQQEVVNAIKSIASSTKKAPRKGKKKSNKKGGKKKKSFWSHALQFASDAAPVALPLALSLLAKGPSGSRNLGALSTSIPTGMAVGLNTGIASQMQSPGILSQIEKRDKFGKVFSTTIIGREELGALTIPDGAVQGDVVFSVDLTPLSGLLAGTRLALQAAGFARFRFLSCAMSVVSSLAATTGGQLAMCILTDPQQTIPSTGGGPHITRLVSDSAGSDVFQVWSNGICSYPGSVNVDPFYTNPLASGAEYLTSAGQGVIVTMIPQTGALEVGTVFLDYEIELLQPTLESFATIAKFAYIQCATGASSCSDAYPLGLAVAPTLVTDNIGISGLVGNGFTLPAGRWWIEWFIDSATVLTNGATAFIAALSAVSPDCQVYTSSNSAGDGNQLFMIHLNALSDDTFIPFGAALTGVTGDTININTIWVFTDPTSFPTLLSSRHRLAAINREAQNFCRAELAFRREQDLEERLRRLEAPPSLLTTRR